MLAWGFRICNNSAHKNPRGLGRFRLHVTVADRRRTLPCRMLALQVHPSARQWTQRCSFAQFASKNREPILRRHAVTLLPRSSWRPFSAEFECRSCGAKEAYRSRPRGFFESYVLPMFFLQPVRCDRCYVRSYVPRSFAARERTQAGRKQPQNQPDATTNHTSRIA